jgi:hypothetical protein
MEISRMNETNSTAPAGESQLSAANVGDNGHTAAPVRYTQQGRETCDRIRDTLGDEGFVAFCRGNAIKYRDRAGAKGDATGDEEKALWYTQMALHVENPARYADPRVSRPGFVSYQRGGGAR